MGLCNVYDFYKNRTVKLSDSYTVDVKLTDVDLAKFIGVIGNYKWANADLMTVKLPECINVTLPEVALKSETYKYGNNSRVFVYPDYEKPEDLKIDLIEHVVERYTDTGTNYVGVVELLVNIFLSKLFDAATFSYKLNDYIPELTITVHSNDFTKQLYYYKFKNLKLSSYNKYTLDYSSTDICKWSLTFSYQSFIQDYEQEIIDTSDKLFGAHVDVLPTPPEKPTESKASALERQPEEPANEDIETAENNTKAVDTPVNKQDDKIDELAYQMMRGELGNGKARKEAAKAAGYSDEEIKAAQAIVNQKDWEGLKARHDARVAGGETTTPEGKANEIKVDSTKSAATTSKELKDIKSKEVELSSQKEVLEKTIKAQEEAIKQQEETHQKLINAHGTALKEYTDEYSGNVNHKGYKEKAEAREEKSKALDTAIKNRSESNEKLKEMRSNLDSLNKQLADIESKESDLKTARAAEEQRLRNAANLANAKDLSEATEKTSTVSKESTKSNAVTSNDNDRVDELAYQMMRGTYDNGKPRIENTKEAGYTTEEHKAAQAIVNQKDWNGLKERHDNRVATEDAKKTEALAQSKTGGYRQPVIASTNVGSNGSSEAYQAALAMAQQKENDSKPVLATAEGMKKQESQPVKPKENLASGSNSSSNTKTSVAVKTENGVTTKTVTYEAQGFDMERERKIAEYATKRYQEELKKGKIKNEGLLIEKLNEEARTAYAEGRIK